MHVHGFPNCFLMTIVQSGFTANYPHLLNEQAKHVAHIVARCLKDGIVRAEATAQAEQEWLDTILRLAVNRRAFLEACTPGYYNNEGRMDARTAASFPYYGAGSMAFFKLLAEWRAQGDFDGLELAGAG